MRYPFALCSHRRLLITPEGWFDGIGHLDAENGILVINVNRLGEGGLRWLLDADGQFYELGWQGRQPGGLAQWLRISRPKELYSIARGRSISVGELTAVASDLGEAFPEAPNSADLRKLLATRPADEIVGRELMRGYFGE